MRKRKDDLIVRCMADRILPLALVYGYSVILHGNTSPGGGFQGGTVCAVAILLIYLGYGPKGARECIRPGVLHVNEALGSIAYIIFALIGIALGYNFCCNVFYGSGSIGDLWSGGTIALMNYAVGYKVLTGVSLLILLMIGLLPDEYDEQGGEGQ